MSKKLTFEFVYNEFKKRNYELLENEYINNSTRMRYKCLKHQNEEQYISYINLQRGCGCKLCRDENRKLTNKKYINKIKPKNVMPMENYVDNNTHIKHKCLICGYESCETPKEVIRKDWKCNSCYPSHLIVVVGVNDMWTTAPEQAKLLLNPDDGYKYTYKSDKKVDWKCECGNIIRNKRIKDVYKVGLSCSLCSNTISYPQRFMCKILNSLNIDFKTEETFKWCEYRLKNTNKSKFGRYDFYFEINNIKYLIETDGGFHFSKYQIGDLTLEEVQFIDSEKNRLAKENNYNLIRIDCLKSELNYIKNSILNSELNNIFDLSEINWEECHKNALKSKIIEACELWNSGIKSSIKISRILKIGRNTATLYLKKCAEIGLCDYDAKIVQQNIGKKSSESNKKKIVCETNNQIFSSLKEAAQYFNISPSHISSCLHNKRNYAGKHPETKEKLTWKFYE